MTDPALRRAFIALHPTLGLVIIIESVRTLTHAMGALAAAALFAAVHGSAWPRRDVEAAT